jgi:hypothetical protein
MGETQRVGEREGERVRVQKIIHCGTGEKGRIGSSWKWEGETMGDGVRGRNDPNNVCTCE